MRRDFSQATQEELLKIVKEVEKANWCGFTDEIGDFWIGIKRFFGGLNPDNYSGNMKKYYRDIIDMCDYSVQRINYIFKKVKETDAIYSAKFDASNCCAESLINQIEKLKMIIAPENNMFYDSVIQNNMNSFSSLLYDGLKKVSQTVEISDEKIIEYCRQRGHGRLDFAGWNYGQHLGEIGFWTTLNAAIFSQDIALQEIIGKIHKLWGDNSSTYAVILYKKQLGATLSKLNEEPEININNPDVQRIVSDLRKYEKTDIEELLKNNKLSRADRLKYQGYLKCFDKIKNIQDTFKYGQKGIDLLAYLVANYENSIKVLEAMRDANPNDPEYQIAVNELIKEYDDKFFGTANKLYEEAATFGINTVFEKVTTSATGGLYLLVDLGISVVGLTTGASGYADAEQKYLGLISVYTNSLDAYDAAVEAVRAGDTSKEAIEKVKLMFGMTKQSLLSIYESMLEMEESHFLNIGETDTKRLYIASEIEKIKNMTMADMDKYQPVSYEEFMKQYS